MRLSGSIVAVGIALALTAADMQAQGDGGYKLVPNWVKMPRHVPAFGPGREFLPPGEREADQDAKRKAGFIGMVEAQPGIGGIAVDSRDRVYVLQRRAELPIMVFDSTGEFLYGGGGDIFSRDSHFVQVDAEGNVWAVDRENQRIIKYNNALDRILMVLGTRGEPGCDPKHFNRPTDVALLSNGDIIVTDGYVNNRVVKYAKDGTFIKMWGGCGPEGAGNADGQLRLSHAVEVDSKDTIYVVDRENKRIVVFDKDGKFIRNIVGAGYAWGIALGPDERHIFATDHDTETVTKIQVSDGALVARFGLGKGWGPGQFDWAHGIAVDSKGAVYVSETYGARLQKYVPSGKSTGSHDSVGASAPRNQVHPHAWKPRRMVRDPLDLRNASIKGRLSLRDRLCGERLSRDGVSGPRCFGITDHAGGHGSRRKPPSNLIRLVSSRWGRHTESMICGDDL